MPESMFGRPSQHLLPSNPPANVGGSTATAGSQTAPVQPAPLTFRDFRFNSIGKPPELLSRISHPQPENVSYHSPSPSPTSTPPPVTNDDVFQAKISSSRPTLLQQLAGLGFNEAGGSSTLASSNHPNGSLASRIQMNISPADSPVSGGFPSQLSRLDGVRGMAENSVNGQSSLIPPIEFLASGPDSTAPTPPTPVSSILESAHPHIPQSSNPLIGASKNGIAGTRPLHSPAPRMSADANASTTASQSGPATTFPRSIPGSTPQTPPPTASSSSQTLPDSYSSFSVADAIMRDLPQPSPATAAAIDSLVARQARLKAINANLSNLASPLPPPPSLSASPVPSTTSRSNENAPPTLHNQPQQDAGPVALHHPYPPDNQSSERPSSSVSVVPMDTNNYALTRVTSSSTFSQEYQTQRKAIVEAVQGLNTALGAAYRAQIDSENALAARIQAFESERAAFEQKKRADELALQNQLRELQQKREELSAKEASLIASEKESKAREVARRMMLAKRQALEEERRAAEEKRRQEVQEQIATALKELQELETLREERQRLQQGRDMTPDLKLVQPPKEMSPEEAAALKSRNDLVLAIRHNRKMHTETMQKFGEANDTLRRLFEGRKRREAEEAERRRVQEERLRAQAEAEQARRVLEQQRRQREEVEAEKRRQETEKASERRGSEEGHATFGRARLLVEQQALAEAQAHGARQTETPSQEIEQRLRQGVSPFQHQTVAEASRIRAAREENSLALPEPSDAMDVDDADRTMATNRAAPSPDIHVSKGGPQKTPSSKSKDKPISGGVMLSVSSRTDGAHPYPKPLATPLPSQSSSDIPAEGSHSVDGAPPSPPSTDSGLEAETSNFPAQLASELNLAGTANADNAGLLRPSTPEHKPIFSRAPKSQTLLDVGNGGSQELNIGPRLGVSPTQRNVNLRHLKRARGRIDENESGDRSVRNRSVKTEDASPLPLKREEHDDQSRELVQAAPPVNPPASLPSRPPVIPPPRPLKKRHHGATSQTTSQPSASSETHDLPFTGEAREVIAEARPGNVPPQASPNSQAMGASAQLPGLTHPPNSLLLAPVHAEPQLTETNFHANERPVQDRVVIHETTSPEPVSATFPHDTDVQDPSRNNRRPEDEHRRGRNVSNSRRQVDHYSPPYASSQPTMPSPPQSYRPGGDSWRPSNAVDAPRAEPMRASSPTAGRKRPADSNDNEHSHRARRQRGDVWIADDHDRERRVDSWRPSQRRSLNSEPDDRRSYRSPPTPDRPRAYGSENQRGTHDRYAAPSSEVSVAPPARYEQPYRRPQNEEPRHQPAPPPANTNYYPMPDQYRPGDNRVGQTYDSPAEERMDVNQDPPLLARMSDTQLYPTSAHSRGRGRGDPSRGRGDPGRGRGRGNGRGGAGLLERLKSGPSSLEERLT